MVRQRYFQVALVLFAVCLPVFVAGCSSPNARSNSSLTITPPGLVDDVLLKLSSAKDYDALVKKLSDGGMGIGYAKYWAGVVALADGDTVSAGSFFSQCLSEKLSNSYELAARMGRGDILFSRADYAGALKIYEKANSRASGHTRFLLIARLCATYSLMNEGQKASSYFLIWKDEFRNLTTSFFTSAQVAQSLKNDLESSSVFVLQAGFFSREELAIELKNKIVAIGEPARIVHESRAYRVIVGPYSGRSVAIKVATRLRSHNIESFVKSWGAK